MVNIKKKRKKKRKKLTFFFKEFLIKDLKIRMRKNVNKCNV